MSSWSTSGPWGRTGTWTRPPSSSSSRRPSWTSRPPGCCPPPRWRTRGTSALLEARDLLFARLLQYRAYKRIAEIFSARLESEGRRFPRTVGLEPHHAELLPEVVISIGAEGFARLAVKAMQPRPRPQVYIDHIHAPLVSVREQAGVVMARLREAGRSASGS